MSNKNVTLAVVVSKAEYDRLVALQKTMEAESLAPVMANALKLFEECVRLAEAGHTFAKIDAQGNQTVFGIF